MEISLKERRIFSEVDSFLNVLDKSYKNKIPDDILRVFSEEKDKNYTKKINPDISFEDQDFMQETIDTILWLNLKYWSTDEEREILTRNVSKQSENRRRHKKERI